MNDKLYLIKHALYNLKWKYIMAAWLFVSKRKGAGLLNHSFSLGIVTYVDRYENFFKPLITHIATLFPDTEIVVAINGYHDQEIQSNYLKKINAFLKDFPNVKIIEFTEAQSLSKLWNLLIRNSSYSKVFIFNDDVKLGPTFRKDLEKSSILNEEVALINRSWSHFLISKNIIKQIGWFDQRFPAVGNEDEDYECRLSLLGISIKSFKINGLKNISFITKNFSWKSTNVINKKYVRENQLFFNSKWEVIDQPEPGYTYVEILGKYVKLIKGMETPDFY